MTLEKPASAKRAKPLRDVQQTKQFLKDWERLSQSGRYDLNRLKAVMLILVSGYPLPPENLDHELHGEWQDYRECHIGGDFLLIYQVVKHGKSEQVIFARAGTHAELFR
jgi:mRNA interferase YafQ